MTYREATMKAYDALHFNLPVIEDYGSKEQLEVQHSAINALDHALAQDEQEPVVWKKSYDIVCALLRQAHDILATTQYPIKREWVGLTDEERRRYNDRLSGSGVAEEIEAKLKEKNGD